MQVSFYNLKSTPIERALPALLQKALDAGMTPSLTVPQGTTAVYSAMLWQGGGGESFLAHDMGDAADDTTPIKLTDTPDFHRPVRFFVNDLQAAWLQGAECAYLVFDSDDTAIVENTRNIWRSLQADGGYNLVYYQQQENGKWLKKVLTPPHK